MDKLKNIEDQNLKSYLSFDNTDLKGKVVYQTAFINILLSWLGPIFAVCSYVTWIIAAVVSVVFIIFMIHFKTKALPTQRYINFYYAMAMIFMSVNLCYNSCIFFSKTSMGVILPLIVYIISLPLCAYLMIYSECKRIIEGYHKDKKFVNPAIVSAVISGAALGAFSVKMIEEQSDENFILGMCCGILGVILSLFSRFFVKWYCHYVLSEKEA